MNLRKNIYLAYARGRGYNFPSLVKQYTKEFRAGHDGGIACAELTKLLQHCRESVPYYGTKMRQVDESYGSKPSSPIEYLSRLPILTKELIRTNFSRLQSADLSRRTWSYNTSGGSTGEPVRLIQDREYDDRCKAISLFYHSVLGRDVGQPLIRLWGAESEIRASTHSISAQLFNRLTGITWLDASNLSSHTLHKCIQTLNHTQPGLIMAYASAAYELAKFAERENLNLQPHKALVASAGTLYPFMRDKIAQVFKCPVYRLYGSREVSLIGCEIPEANGLWVPPWSNFVEILDDNGEPVENGEEGNIVVTCLTNYAMPLLRYWIGDRGAMVPSIPQSRRASAQLLTPMSGRHPDLFRTRDDKLVDGEYFTQLLYQKTWVGRFQVVQRGYEHLLFRIVPSNAKSTQAELDEIAAKSRLIMGDECRVEFEFPSGLPSHPNGTFSQIVSEVFV